MKRSATQANQTSAKKQKLDGKDVFTQEFAKSGIEHSLVKVAAMHAYSVITNKDLSKPPVLVISPKYIANSGMTQEDFEKRFLSLHGGEVKNVMMFNKDKMTTVGGVPGEGMRVLPFKNMVVFLMLKAKDDEEVVFKELMKLIDILVKVNQHTGNVIIGGVLNMLPQLFSARMTTVKHRNDMKSAKELKELEEKFLKEVESDKKINTIVDLKNKEEFGVINETDVNLLTQYLFKEAGMKEDETGPHVEILKDAAKIIGIIQRETDQGKFKLTTAPKSDQLKRGVNVTPPSRLDNIYDDVTVTGQLKRGRKVRAPFRLDNIIYPISNINSRFKITPEQERASKVTNILLQKINNPITLPVNIVNDKIGTIVYADKIYYLLDHFTIPKYARGAEKGIKTVDFLSFTDLINLIMTGTTVNAKRNREIISKLLGILITMSNGKLLEIVQGLYNDIIEMKSKLEAAEERARLEELESENKRLRIIADKERDVINSQYKNFKPMDLSGLESYGLFKDTDINKLTQEYFVKAGLAKDEKGPHVELVKDAGKIIALRRQGFTGSNFKFTAGKPRDENQPILDQVNLDLIRDWSTQKLPNPVFKNTAEKSCDGNQPIPKRSKVGPHYDWSRQKFTNSEFENTAGKPRDENQPIPNGDNLVPLQDWSISNSISLDRIIFPIAILNKRYEIVPSTDLKDVNITIKKKIREDKILTFPIEIVNDKKGELKVNNDKYYILDKYVLPKHNRSQEKHIKNVHYISFVDLISLLNTGITPRAQRFREISAKVLAMMITTTDEELLQTVQELYKQNITLKSNEVVYQEKIRLAELEAENQRHRANAEERAKRREIYNKKLAEIEHNEKIYQEKLRIENEKRKVAEEKRRAEEEKRRAEEEKRRAEEERRRAAEEKRRADAAIEIAKMKAQLAKELEIDVKELENTKQTLVKTNKDLDKQRAVQGRGEFIKVLYINHNECPTLMEKLRPQGDRKRYFSIRKVAFNNDATFYRAYGGSWGLLSESRPLADAANTKNKLMAKLMKDGIINKRTWGLNGTERDYHHYFSKVHPDESLEKDNTFVLELNESMTMKDLGDYLFDHVTPGHEARGRIFIA
ncbi:ORF11 [Ostreid herpesvirus 1]|uniref:ORF11 n=1 Tax=Ostreid herpesvirus 1 (isolate France) TaxID=654903 RepID=Q6R7L2_OSHVF|nr:ORF11 [Ostreid herpesvirus 1]AAS00903.1 ORF11 [Ostreid herpesvirus 1]